MFDQFARTRLLIGDAGQKKLALSKVAVFGVGGVGSFAVEALARAGIGTLTLIDYDVVCLTNINRQLNATHKSVGRAKVAVMKERILDINPAAKVTALQEICREDNCETLVDNDCDYIIDAIDMLAGKIALIVSAKEKGIPIVSSMGAGNKLDPAKFEVADIYRTCVCPLAKAVRKELRKRGVTSLKVVYSQEAPMQLRDADGENQIDPTQRRLPGSISFVPPVVGFILAGEVVKDILAHQNKD